MPLHRIHHDSPPAPGPITIAGDEARHALRVKRLAPGDRVQLLSGRGHTATARITSAGKARKDAWELHIEVEDCQRADPVRPQVHVWAAPPKGPRLEAMIDALSQAGAASWAPLDTKRTVVHPREGKLTRLERIAAEAGKQCGRPWFLHIAPGGTLAQFLAAPQGAMATALRGYGKAPGSERAQPITDNPTAAQDTRPGATPTAPHDPPEATGPGAMPTAPRGYAEPGKPTPPDQPPRTPTPNPAQPPSIILADAQAPPYTPSGRDQIHLLIGPEGGWDPEELAQAQAAGATPASFGPHTMRVETAAPIACAIILNAERES